MSYSVGDRVAVINEGSEYYDDLETTWRVTGSTTNLLGQTLVEVIKVVEDDDLETVFYPWELELDFRAP